MALEGLAVDAAAVGAGLDADAAPLPDVRQCSDAELIREQTAIAAQRRRLDARAAVVAAEIARRSEAGDGSGLGSRRGARDAVDLVQRLTGSTLSEARTLISVGRVTDQQAVSWMRPIGDAVTNGSLGLAAAEAIRTGLGAPTDGVNGAALTAAAERLVEDAARLPVERLAARARAERDLADERGVADREAERRQRRFLRLTPLDDGSTRISGLLDTESAARVRSAFDQVTAPRRSGPRFITAAERDRAAEITDDPRTTEQLLLDRFVEIVERAVAADDGSMFGARRPGVRVHVSLDALRTGAGIARIEGSADAVSISTAQRIACDSGVLPIVFDVHGTPLDVGRTQRLHTVKQRIALAARDGGCRWPDCDKPPSWTEIHHPIPWSRGGRTSIENGISLCAYHHLRTHNEGWRILYEREEYWLIPPPSRAGVPDRIAMPSRTRV
jgi:hypothetical protein